MDNFLLSSVSSTVPGNRSVVNYSNDRHPSRVETKASSPYYNSTFTGGDHGSQIQPLQEGPFGHVRAAVKTETPGAIPFSFSLSLSFFLFPFSLFFSLFSNIYDFLCNTRGGEGAVCTSTYYYYVLLFVAARRTLATRHARVLSAPLAVCGHPTAASCWLQLFSSDFRFFGSTSCSC